MPRRTTGELHAGSRPMNVRAMGRTLVLAAAALSVACAPSAATEAGDTATEASADGPATPSARPTITATNAFYYYADVDAAWRFYTGTLGFETVADYGFAKILRVASASYLTLVDADRGMHSADEPHTVTLALVTDEVEGWYDYLTETGVPMRHELDPEAAPGKAHVGFVAIDPEGYLLEFERFEEHAENERLLPALHEVAPLFPSGNVATARPSDLGVRGTVLWLYYRDTAGANRFYADLLGEEPIVDQGWAWGFRASSSGYLGIVDETRGLHRATDDKAVTVSFFVDDVDAWFDAVKRIDGYEPRSDEVGQESGRVRVFVGYDPENTFLEWDTFLDVEGNERLLQALRNTPAF